MVLLIMLRVGLVNILRTPVPGDPVIVGRWIVAERVAG
jgi:hypothetical protein